MSREMIYDFLPRVCLGFQSLLRSRVSIFPLASTTCILSPRLPADAEFADL